MSRVSPAKIYKMLLNAGYSTHQAIGIMANMFHESGFDPEATAPGGASFGLVQWTPGSYPKAASLVTGNTQRDLAAQIKYLTITAPRNALTGSSSAEVAGNFAQNFERCAGCQPGGAQYNARRAEAKVLDRAAKSGKWPTKATGQSNFATGSETAQTETCLIAAPKLAFLGGGCILSKTNGRALIGGVLIGAAIPLSLTGAILLVIAVAGQTKAGRAVAKTAGTVATVVPGGAAVRGVARGAKGGRRASRAAQEVKAERRLGQPRENPDLREGRGAIRETPAGTRRRRESGKDAANRAANGSRGPASRAEAGF